MTLDEKVNQLEDWATAIPRWHSGLSDVERGSAWDRARGLRHGVSAGHRMAATWDPGIVQSMGNVISDEARAKYNQAQREDNHRIFYGLTFWSPNINIFRDPRWGAARRLRRRSILDFAHGCCIYFRCAGPDLNHLRAGGN